jgi:hypothetical protein
VSFCSKATTQAYRKRLPELFWYMCSQDISKDKKIMKYGVITSYRINNSQYASYILGENINAIKKIAAKRNLNETIDSTIMEITSPLPDYTLLSDEDILNQKEELLHTICFLSFVSLKSKKIKIEEVLGDEGVIHEISHLLSGSFSEQKKSLTNVRDLIKKLHQTAIGLYEPV